MSVKGRSEDEENAELLPGSFTFGFPSSRGCIDLDGWLSRNERAVEGSKFYGSLVHSLCRYLDPPPLIEPPEPDDDANANAADDENDAEADDAGDQENSLRTKIPSSKRKKRPECFKWDDVPTLIVHRFEYVNLYHTFTEILGAYVSLQNAKANGLISDDEKVRVMFLDGHAAGNLDDLWQAVFNQGLYKTIRVGKLRKTLCLKRFVVAEIGYAASINLHLNDVSTFSTPLSVSAYGASGFDSSWCISQDVLRLGKQIAELGTKSQTPDTKLRVLYIARDRPMVIAHPRMQENQNLERATADDGSIEERALKMSTDHLDVRVVRLSNMPWRDQIALIRSAAVVIAVHGAALTHLIWSRPEALFIELAPSEYLQRIHFAKMAARSGRRLVRFGGSNSVSPFLQQDGSTLSFTADMFETIVTWSLYPTDDERLAAIPNGNNFA